MMKHRIRLSVTLVIEAPDRESALEKAVLHGGMDPSAEYLGPVQDHAVSPHNVGVEHKVTVS